MTSSCYLQFRLQNAASPGIQSNHGKNCFIGVLLWRCGGVVTSALVERGRYDLERSVCFLLALLRVWCYLVCVLYFSLSSMLVRLNLL